MNFRHREPLEQAFSPTVTRGAPSNGTPISARVDVPRVVSLTVYRFRVLTPGKSSSSKSGYKEVDVVPFFSPSSVDSPRRYEVFLHYNFIRVSPSCYTTNSCVWDPGRLQGQG